MTLNASAMIRMLPAAVITDIALTFHPLAITVI
jgi:hypothetical protein